ncbi:HlyD family efflux transporter periplasmic adaptor subunit [Clostridium sp. WLY-B-L2]|uniref:HlyD family efflux transporter periplasmic adaptor subunit n=1 Tax=Clostridium aromativorans TaxID=2836848 RepID=A0ABS8N1C3_9CLOT|nr:HlyD family efflux transporter periplasmic adaptor subunit [Clostridium aromativorans]MCC9293597.1 HlyD family efflux transporter periplasmic adaptor subunit [Clostridium aromativorans]
MKFDIISVIRENRKKMILGVLIAAAVIVVSLISHYVYEHIYYVSTDDAKVTADLINVSPQIRGKLLEFDGDEGDTVVKDEIIARQDMGNLPDSNVDQSLIRAPIDGLIVKKQANVGDNLSPDKTIALLADPNSYYIIANVDETETRRLQYGQKVDVSIDEYGSKKFTGKVQSVGQMSQDALKPNSYSKDGKYKKTVQKVPVKIKFDSSSNLKGKFTIGDNASVKIRVVNK